MITGPTRPKGSEIFTIVDKVVLFVTLCWEVSMTEYFNSSLAGFQIKPNVFGFLSAWIIRSVLEYVDSLKTFGSLEAHFQSSNPACEKRFMMFSFKRRASSIEVDPVSRSST